MYDLLSAFVPLLIVGLTLVIVTTFPHNMDGGDATP